MLCRRELQICHEFTRFSARMKGVTIANFYGGIPASQNKETLKKAIPNIVVGTPGRIKQVQPLPVQPASIRLAATAVVDPR